MAIAAVVAGEKLSTGAAAGLPGVAMMATVIYGAAFASTLASTECAFVIGLVCCVLIIRHSESTFLAGGVFPAIMAAPALLLLLEKHKIR